MLRGADLPSLDGVGYLLLQLETPLETVTAFARAARDSGVKVVLNAAPACALPASLLAARRRADRQRGRAREGRGASRRGGRSARVARCAVRGRHARRARLLRDASAATFYPAACFQGRAGRYDRGRRHFLRRARSRAVLGVPPTAGTAPCERRRSPRDDARRRAVEHPGHAGGRSAAALPCGRPHRRESTSSLSTAACDHSTS